MCTGASFGHYIAGVPPIRNQAPRPTLYLNEVHSCFFASTGEDWDYLLVPQYRSRRSFIEMITDPHYQELLKYRSGALRQQSIN